jgi:hypothetical protein
VVFQYLLSQRPPSLKPPLEENIVWASSAVDICDAIVTSVASRAVAILDEGSPGTGKVCHRFQFDFALLMFVERQHSVASATLKALGLEYHRVSLSPTSTTEDLFGSELLQSTTPA